MKRIVLGVAASVVLAYAGSSEITIIGGGVDTLHSHRYNKHETYGVRAGLGLETALVDQIELGYDYSPNVEYRPNDIYLKNESPLHRVYLNIVKEVELVKPLKFYALAGVGYEVFQEDLPQRARTFGQYGAGLKLYFTDNIAIRGEVRQGIEFSSPNRDNIFYGLGLVYSFGGKEAAPAPVVAQVAQVEQPQIIEEAPVEQASVQEEVVTEQPAQQPTLALIIEASDNTDDDTTAESAPVLTPTNVHFAIDSSRIQESDAITLKGIATDLQSEENLNVKVLIKGHTDSTGSEIYNLKLSQRRANAVKNSLVEQGVNKDRITAKGYGELEPIETNLTKDGRAANRRSEIIFQ